MMIPLIILNKPGKLTTKEFEAVRTIRVEGHKMLLEAAASARRAGCCLHHHEKVEQRYPERLTDAQISLLPRWARLCDVI